jgi:hypothetical protein
MYPNQSPSRCIGLQTDMGNADNACQIAGEERASVVRSAGVRSAPAGDEVWPEEARREMEEAVVRQHAEAATRTGEGSVVA